MKINNRKKLTSQKLNEHSVELDRIVRDYSANDIKKLSRIAFLIASIEEYFTANRSANSLLLNYFKTTYKVDYCLILSRTQIICRDEFKILPNESQQGFSRNNIIKFLRGEHAHLNSLPNDDKLKILNGFIHEENEYISIFAIGHNFIRTPNLIEHKNVGDSEGSIVHSYKTKSGKIEKLSTIESIVINIYKEISETVTHRKIYWAKAQLDWPEKNTKTLYPGLKKHISENIIKQLPKWDKWRNNYNVWKKIQK